MPTKKTTTRKTPAKPRAASTTRKASTRKTATGSGRVAAAAKKPLRPNSSELGVNAGYHAAEDLFYIKEKKYVDVTEGLAEGERRKTLTILIIIPFVVALAILWFVQLKRSVVESARDISFDGIQSQISGSIDQFKNSFEFDNASGTEQLTEEKFQQIKDGLMEKIKNGQDPALWPTHQFEKLGLAMQYPANWSQSATGTDSLKITDAASSTATSTASIGIRTQTVKKDFDLDKWLADNFKGYAKASGTSPIAGLAATEIRKSGLAEGTVDSVICFQKDARLYVIEIISTGLESELPIIDGIIRSIKTL